MEIKEIIKQLEKDEYGLYTQASNYDECKIDIIIAEMLNKINEPS